ncbi:AAEL002074-PA [Aedes aegypti]|uniref:AAEL002074-PA n=1 Tax=Aedes aegypti TaxID=7159 RepID=Q17JE3_AEDAE|nr:AAEL002074-PA [Aedes aegypti]
MSTLVNMYRALRGSPVTLLGGAILITGSVMFVVKRVYEPYKARNRRAEAEYIADYLFRKEQESRGVEFHDDNVTLKD